MLTVLFMLFAVSLVSFAEEDYFRENALKFEVINDDNEEPPATVMLFSSGIQPIEEYLAVQFENHPERVYVSQYDITLSEMLVILSEHYEYMVVSGSFKFKTKDDSADSSDPTLEYITPKYIFSSPDEDEAGRRFIEDSVKAYADYARSKTNDPVEQLLLVHDKILKNTKYDFNYNTVSFSAYGLFKNNTCVCQGYAEAIYMIAKELGIDAGFCSYFFKNSSGKFEGHIWNYIKVGEKWYQLDATWNEPTYEYKDEEDKIQHAEYENAGHGYFLVSDAVIEKGHYSKNIWKTSLNETPVCDDEKYETNHFFNIAQLCEITYGDGFLQTALKAGSTTIELRTYGGIYTGPVIISKIGETDDSFTMYYYFLENLRSFDVMVKADEDDLLRDCKIYSKKVPDGYNFQYNVVLDTIPKSDFLNTQDLTMYIWDISSLKPFSQKVQLN